MLSKTKAFRASILHFTDDPDKTGEKAYRYFEDGILTVADGKVTGLDDAAKILPGLKDRAEIIDYRGKLIIPGLIDTHLHYPQTDIIASFGEQLLQWLNKYTFPAEGKFGDKGHAREVAGFFFDELLSNGTTTAMIFSTVHKTSVEALFETALERNIRVISGKVMMDRNCPEFLQDTPEKGYTESNELIRDWQGKGRIDYAITPRFAPTSTPAQMEAVRRLAAEHPDLHMQTHVAENRAEVSWVAELYPEARSYLDVYERYGMLRPKSVFAHCIYLDETDMRRMGETGAVAAHCPTSNLFLGSGLMECVTAEKHGIRVGIGTDVGGGSSFSMFRTLDETYKVSQMAGLPLTPLKLFYLATLGGARSLYLDDRIGNFETGKEADFAVLDLEATPLLKRRLTRTETLEEKLFVLLILADDRAVRATYLMGEKAHDREIPRH